MEAVSDCLQSQVFLARPKDITHYLLWSPSRFLKRPFCPKSWATIPIFPYRLAAQPCGRQSYIGKVPRYARFDETSPSPTRMNSVKNHLSQKLHISHVWSSRSSSSLFVVVGEYMYVP